MNIKPVVGYEGDYEVSDTGRIFSLKSGRRKELIGHKGDGYRRACFWVDGKRKMLPIHRLVAIAFIPNPMKKPFVNHLDGSRSNNNISNLEWCTREENQKHSREVLGNTGRGNKNSNHRRYKSKYTPTYELQNKLIAIGVPKYNHDIVSLGEMLPANTCTEKEADGTFMVSYVEGSMHNKFFEADTEADARAKMLIWLLENNHVTTEEINEC